MGSENPKTIIIEKPPFDHMIPSKSALTEDSRGVIPNCASRCKVTALRIAKCLSLRTKPHQEFDNKDALVISGKAGVGACAEEAVIRAYEETGKIACDCRDRTADVLECSLLAAELQTNRSPGTSDKAFNAQEALGRAMSRCSSEAIES